MKTFLLLAFLVSPYALCTEPIKIGATNFYSDGTTSIGVGNTRFINHSGGGTTTVQTVGGTSYMSGEVSGTVYKSGNTTYGSGTLDNGSYNWDSTSTRYNRYMRVRKDK